jgi:predicted RNA-binding protein associated with RNAse of E/G family
LEHGLVAAEDLALDVFVLPDGTLYVLDEDEFEALALPQEERQAALAVVDDLCRAVQDRTPPFDAVRVDAAG